MIADAGVLFPGRHAGAELQAGLVDTCGGHLVAVHQVRADLARSLPDPLAAL
jgi:hypothetical protein